MIKRLITFFLLITISLLPMPVTVVNEFFPNKTYAVIDRIENNHSVVVLFPNGDESILSLDTFPKDIDVGMWILLEGSTLQIDKNKTEQKANETRRLTNELRKKARVRK